MADPKALSPGDRCPNCQGPFEPAPVPTAEQRKRAADRENREPVPPHYDTASEAERERLGALYRCTRCRYATRFPLEAPASA